MSPVIIEPLQDWGIDLSGFSGESKVWIYMTPTPYSNQEAERIKSEIHNFCHNWTSHNKELSSAGTILHNRFIILSVDESNTAASGCSIDKSLAFVKYLEQQYGQPLLLRTNIAYRSGTEISVLPISELKEACKTGIVNDDTIVFDNLVNTWHAFKERWEVPLKGSWMARFI